MLSRREMGALCAALLLCLLLSLGAGWAKGQLDAADALAADTLRLHIRADTNAVRDQSAKLAVRDAVLALADESCPADGKADAKVWAAASGQSVPPASTASSRGAVTSLHHSTSRNRTRYSPQTRSFSSGRAYPPQADRQRPG